MLSFWIPVLINGVVGFLLTRWAWIRGFRRGYMAGMTDTQAQLDEQIGRLMRKEPPDD